MTNASVLSKARALCLGRRKNKALCLDKRKIVQKACSSAIRPDETDTRGDEILIYGKALFACWSDRGKEGSHDVRSSVGQRMAKCNVTR